MIARDSALKSAKKRSGELSIALQVLKSVKIRSGGSPFEKNAYISHGTNGGFAGSK